MSRVATTARPSARAGSLALPADVVAVGCVVLVAVGLALATWLAWGDLTRDTGFDWVAGDRLGDRGDIPYADFPYYYGPLGVGLLGVAYQVLEPTVAANVAIGLALAVAAIGLTYVLTRRLAGPGGAAVAAALAATAAFGTGNMNFVMPHAISAPLAVVASLCALWAASYSIDHGRRRWLVGSGLAAGIVTLTRPEFAAAILVALTLWFAVRLARAWRDGRASALADAAVCLGTMALVAAVSYGVVLTQVSPSDLVHKNLVPTALLDAGSRHVLELSAPLTAGSFATLAGHLALYALGCGALVLLGVLLTTRHDARRVALIAAAAIVTLAVLVTAFDPELVRAKLRFVFAWIPAGAAVAAIVIAWRALRHGAWGIGEQTALLVVAFLAVLSAKTYASFLPQPDARVSKFALYALPFAAVFLVWLHSQALATGSAAALLGLGWVAAVCAMCVVLVIHDGRRETARIHAVNGSLAVPAAQRAPLQAALDTIRRSTRPTDGVLVAPQLSSLLALTGRHAPLPQISLLPGALATPADERAAIARLQDTGLTLAITDRRPLTEYGQGAFGTTFDRHLGAWLQSHFRHAAVLRGAGEQPIALDIWMRREP